MMQEGRWVKDQSTGSLGMRLFAFSYLIDLYPFTTANTQLTRLALLLFLKMHF